MKNELELIRRYGWLMWVDMVLWAPFVGIASALDGVPVDQRDCWERTAEAMDRAKRESGF